MPGTTDESGLERASSTSQSSAINSKRVAMPPDIEIRHVQPGDAALFARIAADVFDAPVDPARLVAYLAEPGHHMLVALRAREVVAQVAAVIHRHPDKPTELYIDEVGVTPALQRQGIARRMVDQMFALGKALGCEEAWVGTEPENAAARGLYESRGAAAVPMVMFEYELWSGMTSGEAPRAARRSR